MSDLERLLRDDARIAIPDGGFSARVMGALPRKAQSPPAWLRPALVISSGLLGSALALLFAPRDYSLLQGFADVARLHFFTPAAVMGIGMGAALLVCALVLATE